MLFYNQIKREFSKERFKQGQICFRRERVSDVRMDGNRVKGKIKGDDGAMHLASVTMLRGTILNPNCSCAARRDDSKNCEHLAALCIWVVERGSLLRSGVLKGDRSAPEPEEDEKPEPVDGEPVIYVRGAFQKNVFTSLSVEPAIRYRDPETRQVKVTTLNYLIKQQEIRTWKTTTGVFLKLERESVPILGSIESATLIYQGQAAVDQLARVLANENRSQVLLHESVDVKLDPDPLRLVSLRIGKRSGKSRSLFYEFRNSSIKVTSDDLRKQALEGKLSGHYFWRDDRIYRFERSLIQLSRYANRSGVAANEDSAATIQLDGFGTIFDHDEQPLHPLAAYRLSLELGVADFTVDEEWEEFHEWLKLFEKNKLPTLPEMEYGYELRDYQRNGLSWLWSLYHRGLAALLADDMGLGKTHQTLALLTSTYCARKKPAHSSLVVAPTSVITAWIQKLKKYDTGLTWHVFHGNSRVLPDPKVNLVLTTYGVLQREFALRERDWHMVILDEAQAIKNSNTLNFRASRALRSRYRIAMTGTPVENHSTDIWSIMEFLLPGYLGSLARFKRLYGSASEAPSFEQTEALKRLISPFLLRRTKGQVLKELPEKTEEIVPCEMTKAQRKAYQSILRSNEAMQVRENLENEGTKIDYANILALLTRLKQACDHPRLADLTSGQIEELSTVDPMESGKWEALDELVTEALGSDLKIVIFTQYLGMIDLVAHWLKGRGVGYTEMRGDTSDREERLNRFAQDPDCRVFICSLLAGGLGIDLTSASVCIHLDRWWNPAKENQATDRLHRIGQTRGVQVFKLQIPGTVEDRIAEIIQSKMALSGALIAESRVGLKSFSRRELLELLLPE